MVIACEFAMFRGICHPGIFCVFDIGFIATWPGLHLCGLLRLFDFVVLIAVSINICLLLVVILLIAFWL